MLPFHTNKHLARKATSCTRVWKLSTAARNSSLHHFYLKQHGTNLWYEWSIAANLMQCLIKANTSLWPICSMDIILIANIGSHPNKSTVLQRRCLHLCQLNIYPVLPTVIAQQDLGTERTRRLLSTPPSFQWLIIFIELKALHGLKPGPISIKPQTSMDQNFTYGVRQQRCLVWMTSHINAKEKYVSSHRRNVIQSVPGLQSWVRTTWAFLASK